MDIVNINIDQLIPINKRFLRDFAESLYRGEGQFMFHKKYLLVVGWVDLNCVLE